MKKTKALFAALLLMVAGNVMADNKVTAADVTIKAGETADVAISITNEGTVLGWSFQLKLPEGVSVVYDEDEEDYLYDFSDHVPKSKKGVAKLSPDIRETAEEGVLQFSFVGKTADDVLDGNEGEVMTITVKADANLESAVAEGALTNISHSDPDAVSLPVEKTSNFTVTIEGTVPVGIQEVEAANAKAPVYNLGGQRVEKTTKGLYVKNGKKVVVK